MRRNKKSGFTLIELMVVAIIVAILAAIAIPLMSGNKDRAIATEAQSGIGAIVTALKVYVTDQGVAPGAVAGSALSTTLKTLKSAELDGKYFQQSDYDLTGSTYDPDTGAMTYTVTADTDKVILTVTSGTNEWSGSLLGD